MLSDSTTPNSPARVAQDQARGVVTMWRPTQVGVVVAERRCEFCDGTKRKRKLTIRFGRPVQERRASRSDPWWCPIEVLGRGFERFDAIAGEDSLQALLLAVAWAERLLTREAKRRGGIMIACGVENAPLLCHSSLVARSGRRRKQPQPTR